MVMQKLMMVGQGTVMTGQMPGHAHPWLHHWFDLPLRLFKSIGSLIGVVGSFHSSLEHDFEL